MANYQVPNPTISLATENALGEMTSIAPINFYNPVPVKNYSTGEVLPAKKTSEDILSEIASGIFDNTIKEINKNTGLTNPLTNPKQVPYSETKRYQDPELGYLDNYNNEFLYGENQGFWGAVGNAGIQSAGNFISSFLGNATTEYSIASAIRNQDFSKLFDNDAVNAANAFSELGQKWGTVYDTRQMRDNPLLSRKVATATISSLGYLGAFAGAALKDVAISAALGPGAGVGLAGIQLAQAFKKLGDYTKILTNGEDGINALRQAFNITGDITKATLQAARNVPFREGFRKFNQYTQGMFEASIEAKETVSTVENKLKEEYFIQNGFEANGEDLEAIKKKANEAGNWTYFANAALLTTTNHFEFGEMFERWRVGKRNFDALQGNLDLGLDGYNKVISNLPKKGVLPKDASFLTKAKDYAVRAARNTPSAFTLSTGEFIEEMGQGVISGSTEDYYTNFINPPSNGIQSTLRALEDQFTTQEGWLSGISGLLTGAAMSGILSAAGVNPMDKTPSDVYTDAVIEELNNNNIGAFLKDKIQVNQIRETDKLEKGEFLKSDYEKQAEDHLNTYQYWLTGLKHKQYDLRVQQLQEAKNLQGKDFTDEWGLEYDEYTKAVVDRFIDEQLARGKRIKEAFDHVDRTFINPFDRKTRFGRSNENSESYALYDAIKDELAFQISKFDNNSRYIDDHLDNLTKTLKITPNPQDILNLGSLYGEEIEGSVSERNGNVFQLYKIKNKAENSDQGLAKIKKDLDKELKNINKALELESLDPDSRRSYTIDKKLKENLSSQLETLLSDGITEVFTDSEGKTGVRDTDDYLAFISEYLRYLRKQAGINEELTSNDYRDFYKSIRSVNLATLSNERTAKVMNDLLSANAVKNFKRRGEEIKAVRDKIEKEQELKAQEESKSATVAQKSEETVENTAETTEEVQDEQPEVAEVNSNEPEKGKTYTGEVFTKDEDGKDVSVKGDFQIVDVDKIDDTVTIRQGNKEIVVPIEDFNESDIIEKQSTKPTRTEKAESEKPVEGVINLTDIQQEDIEETENTIVETAVYDSTILEQNTEDNTITIEDEEGNEEVFKTLTNALGQNYSENISDIFKKVAIQTSIVLHALFSKSDTQYGEIENIPDITEDRFNEIYEGFQNYNNWLINNNYKIVEKNFYIKDYNVNNEEGNNALIHIDLLIYDKKNSLYEVVDFKTRSLYSGQKIVNGQEGNSPLEWDTQQLKYKVDVLKKTLSTADITKKNFSGLSYLFRFNTEYSNKQLTKITHNEEPSSIDVGLGNRYRDTKILKIEGQTISSLKQMNSENFIKTLRKNGIPYKFLVGAASVNEQWDSLRKRLGQELPPYTKGSDNKEFWAWVNETFELFEISESQAPVIDTEKLDSKIQDFLTELSKRVKETQDDIEMQFTHANNHTTTIQGSYDYETGDVLYSNFDYAVVNGTEEDVIKVLKGREYSATEVVKHWYYVPKTELYVKNDFTTKYKVFVNGRKVNEDRSVQQIIDDYGTTNLKAIVKKLSEESKFQTEKELASNIVDKIPNRFSIEFVDSLTEDNRTPAYYDPKSEKLQINVARLKELGYSVDNAILHETIHVLTSQRLRKSTKFIQDITGLRNEVTNYTLTPEGRTTLANIYGTSDVTIYGLGSNDEFVAEALTSPDFQNLLRTIKTKVDKEDKKSIWSRFIDFIRSSLGLKVDGFEDTLLAKTVYRIGKEFDTLNPESIGNGFNLDYTFGKTILKIESKDQYEDTNAFGNKVIRENSLSDILENAVVVKEGGSKESFKPLTGFNNIYVSKYPYNLVIKYPNGNNGMEPFTSMGLVAGYRFKRTQSNYISEGDRIIFGHPGIGKTFLRESRNDIIDFDTDYKIRINQEFGLDPGFKALNNWRTKNDETYKDRIRILWKEALNEARTTNKILVASDMTLLREFPNDFDKVITIPEKTFVERAKQRNDYTMGETELWKHNLDKTIAEVNPNKIISTTKYFSDLFSNNNELLTLDRLADPDISDSEFEQITHVDASLRNEFIQKLNNYITYQEELVKQTSDIPLKNTNVELTRNYGTLELVPYNNRTNVNDMKPVMFRGIDGVSPAPLILQRNYLWELGGGKTRPKESGFSTIYNDPVFETSLSGVINFLNSNIAEINNNINGTYVLVIPKGGIQQDKQGDFTMNDFDFVPVYSGEYNINDNTYLDNLKFLSQYAENNFPAESYDRSQEALKMVKTVYLAAPEKYQFQDYSDSTMSANSAEISITDGHNNSKVKGYLQYKFRSSIPNNDLVVSISPAELREINSIPDLIDVINEKLEVKIKGTASDIEVDFKLQPQNFKLALPKVEDVGDTIFLNAIDEGRLFSPLHKNIRNVSIVITPKTVTKQLEAPKVEDVIYVEPVVEAQNEAIADMNNQNKSDEVSLEELRASRTQRGKPNIHRRRNYGYPGIENDKRIEDLINVCG